MRVFVFFKTDVNSSIATSFRIQRKSSNMQRNTCDFLTDKHKQKHTLASLDTDQVQSQRQNLKYLGYICRMDTGELLEQMAFDIRPTSQVMWKRFANLLGPGVKRIRRNLMSKAELELLRYKIMSRQQYNKKQVAEMKLMMKEQITLIK